MLVGLSAGALPSGGIAHAAPGAVFSITNNAAPNSNSVTVFDRDADGTLEKPGEFRTGGRAPARPRIQPMG